ncbi:MAG: hypothetical protein J7L31_00885 [Thermoplasmata archaeon]|nr:hypothetical protein [Thermoplasmata archaeon]
MKRKTWMIISFIFFMSAGLLVAAMYPEIEKMFRPPTQYRWEGGINVEDSFGWGDFINGELGKVSEYPIFVENGTKYLHIYIEVDFSNPINPDLEILNQGNLNFSILSPSGKNITKSYCTTLKDHTYEEYFYFENPEKGQWKVKIKVAGYGKYRISAQMYQPIE